MLNQLFAPIFHGYSVILIKTSLIGRNLLGAKTKFKFQINILIKNMDKLVQFVTFTPYNSKSNGNNCLGKWNCHKLN